MRLTRIALLSLMLVIPLSADEENNITTGSVDHLVDDSKVSLEPVTETEGPVDDGAAVSDNMNGEKNGVLADESIDHQHEDSGESNSIENETYPTLTSMNTDDESSSDLPDADTGLKQETRIHNEKERKNEESSQGNVQSIEHSDQDDVELNNSVDMADEGIENIHNSEKESEDEESSQINDKELHETISETVSSGKALEEESTPKTVFVDYANKSTGALILEKAKNFQGTSNLLLDDKDRYAMIPCNDEKTKYVIIGLSEDILVKSIKLSSFERYSSLTKQFQVLGSQTYPIMTEWEDLGTFEAKPWFKENKEQTFELKIPSWARYLKFRFLSHYGDEHYLTVTQIKVHGSTALQGYHEMQLEMEANQAEDVDETVSEVETSKENEQPTTISVKGVDESIHVVASEEQNSSVSDDMNTGASVESATEKEMNDEVNSNDEIIPSESEVTLSADTTEDVDASATLDHEKSEKSQEPQRSTTEKASGESTSESYENSEDLSNQHTDSNEMAEMIDSTAESDVNDSASRSNIAEEAPMIEDVSIPLNSSDDNDENMIPQDADKVKSLNVNTPKVKEVVKSAIETVQKVATIKDAVKEINKSLHSRVQDNEQKTTEGVVSDHETSTVPTKDNTAVQDDGKSQDHTIAIISEESSIEVGKDNKVESDAVVGSNGTEASNINSTTFDATHTSSTNESNLDNKVNSVPKITEGIDISSESKDMLKRLTSEYSNSDCLKNLDFQEFKKNTTKAIQAQKGSTAGPASSIPKNEPIFKKLSDEIKVLQASQGIYEQYIKAVSTCYESLMSNMVEHIKSIEDSQERRITSIEEKMKQILIGQVPVISTNDDQGFETVINDEEDESFLGRVHSYFVTFINWVVVVYLFVFDTLKSVLADERVQKGIEVILGYKRDISLVLLGYMFSLLLTLYKVKGQNEVTSQKTITQTSYPNSNGSSHNKRDREIPVPLPSLHEDTSIIYSFRSDDVSLDGENEGTNHLNMNIKTRL
jgi:hypothetical protein